MAHICGSGCSDCAHLCSVTNPKDYEPLRQRNVVSKEALLDPIPSDWDEIEWDRPWDEIGPSETSDTKEAANRVPEENIAGDAALQVKIKALIQSYSDVFSATLTPEPARVECFELKVDTEKWLASAGGRAPRMMSKDKMKEVKRQIDSMMELKLIRPSQAPAVSHVMLAPKPGGKWRFCVDYRTLDLLSESLSWPIPNIKMMLERIGTRRAKYFAILDLSQGFYQVPLHESSKALTAFTTWCGVFEWNRLPMGIKGAPPFFQYIMATFVLVGLIYVICELYIDDICVHAQTEEEYLENLTQVLERCRKHNIKLNPAKCKFGLSEVEYVGHTINEQGIHFVRSRLDSVLDFELPKLGKQLKSFIGFCNYFRDHVRDFSAKMFPLNQLIRDYDKRRRLVWTEDTIKAFEDMKEAIHECPSLFFMDEKLAIFLHTDASKYGIGAYLFQIDSEGKERPIAFISKTLSDAQRRWHTPQKEAYAIFYAFKQLDYLLRGYKFTLRTDHKNLTYINDTMTEMVIRWKIAVQEYDFDVEHIPGVDNVIADGLSRLISSEGNEQEPSVVSTMLASLCPFQPLEDEQHYLSVFWEEEDIISDIICSISASGEEAESMSQKIPSFLRTLIKRTHNSFVGHHGLDRTLDKILSVLESDKTLFAQISETPQQIKQYVSQFLKQCPVCQKLNTMKFPIQTEAFTTATYEPHQRLNIDTIGPLPPDENGNCYILVLIDTFTRWIELYPIKTVTGEEAAKVLLQHFGRFGQANELQSDNGSQFVNEIIDSLCILVGTEHKRTLAYSSEENGMVERAKKEVLRHLRAIIHDTKVIEKWGMYLPFVQRIMNSAVSKTLGVSPAQLLFGNAITLNRSILVDLPVHVKKDLSEWANDMVESQLLAIDRAAVYQREADEKNTSKRQRSEPTLFPDAALVLSEYHKTGFRKGPPHKLLTPLKGPLQVVDHDKNTYTLRDLGTQKCEKHHVTDLRPFQYDPDTTNPFEVANSDSQLHIIERIVSHTGDKRQKSKMTFKVKWLGYDGHPDEYTDEPWANVRTTIALHEYLRTHNMESLIPTQFRR